METKHIFKWVLKENIARKLDHKAYKKVQSWLRLCRRKAEGQIDFEEMHNQWIKQQMGDMPFYDEGSIYETKVGASA